jgi:hypothetical protein
VFTACWRVVARTLRSVQKRNWDFEMKIKRGLRFRQALLSLGVFGAVLAGLASVNPRVREQLENLVYGGGGLTSIDNRVMDLGHALVTAVKTQSIDNNPMMVFVAVGAVLFLFMFRT